MTRPIRLLLVTHAATAATRRAAFPRDEAPERPVAPRAPRGRIRHGPERRCRDTAAALGDPLVPDTGLRDWDLGRWAGATLDEVAAAEPDAATAWLTDPDAAPHGGEPLTALLARARAWLDGVTEATVAVTHPAVVRAVVLAVLDAPPPAFWRLEAGPLTAADLRGGPGRWTVRATGRAL